jgi:hypothetical protein
MNLNLSHSILKSDKSEYTTYCYDRVVKKRNDKKKQMKNENNHQGQFFHLYHCQVIIFIILVFSALLIFHPFHTSMSNIFMSETYY